MNLTFIKSNYKMKNVLLVLSPNPKSFDLPTDHKLYSLNWILEKIISLYLKVFLMLFKPFLINKKVYVLKCAENLNINAKAYMSTLTQEEFTIAESEAFKSTKKFLKRTPRIFNYKNVNTLNCRSLFFTASQFFIKKKQFEKIIENLNIGKVFFTENVSISSQVIKTICEEKNLNYSSINNNFIFEIVKVISYAKHILIYLQHLFKKQKNISAKAGNRVLIIIERYHLLEIFKDLISRYKNKSLIVTEDGSIHNKITKIIDNYDNSQLININKLFVSFRFNNFYKLKRLFESNLLNWKTNYPWIECYYLRWFYRLPVNLQYILRMNFLFNSFNELKLMLVDNDQGPMVIPSIQIARNKSKAKKLFCIQHGLMEREVLGWQAPVTSDISFVWGKYFKERLSSLKLNSSAKIIVSGNPLLNKFKFDSERITLPFKKFILFTAQPDFKSKIVLKELLHIFKIINKNLVIKVHPKESISLYRRLVQKQLGCIPKNIFIVKNQAVLTLIKTTTFLLTSFSTTMLEAVRFKTPFLLINWIDDCSYDISKIFNSPPVLIDSPKMLRDDLNFILSDKNIRKQYINQIDEKGDYLLSLKNRDLVQIIDAYL
jgi:hypothetical protein